jgi:hypothetical protein
MSDKPCKEINTVYELNYAGIAMDYFYEKHKVTQEIEELPPIPMEATWSLRPFFSGSYISRFRIVERNKVVSVVLQWFNCFDKCLQPHYNIIPLRKFKKDELLNERCFEIDQVQEIHDHIKFLFDNWDEG